MDSTEHRHQRIGTTIALQIDRAALPDPDNENTMTEDYFQETTASMAIRAKDLLWEIGYGVFGRVAPPSSWLFHNIQVMNLHAARRYTPRVYPGRMTVLLSGSVWPGFQLDPDLDICGMNADEIDVHLVPGDRDSMMRGPHVGVLAEQLQISLDRARAAAIRKYADSWKEKDAESSAVETL